MITGLFLFFTKMKIKASELKKSPKKTSKKEPVKTVSKEGVAVAIQEEVKEEKPEINLSKTVYRTNLPVVDAQGYFLHGVSYLHPKHLDSCLESLQHFINELEGLWDKQTPQQKVYLLTIKGKLEQMLEAKEILKKKNKKVGV